MDPGKRVKALRKKRGLSQEQLGAMIGFSQSKISKIENGYCDSLSDLRLIAADRKSTRLNSSHPTTSRMPSSA